MKFTLRCLLPLLALFACARAESLAPAAPKPVYVDPLFDGAADPCLVWDREASLWRMFYTARRAGVPGLDGVTWVHGTPIGVAESRDFGTTWTYAWTAAINDGSEVQQSTQWAPEVFHAGGRYHMFLTVVPGVFKDWKHPRSIVHLTSGNLKDWGDPEPLKLESDRVIDACLLQLPNGTWRIWYNNERDRKSIYYADSRDLGTWELLGKAVADQAGEGPKVFRWKGTWWMITDVWQGLALYHSDDATRWTRQEGTILKEPGTGKDDAAIGGHADVVVNGERAFVFYFTHPGRAPGQPKADGPLQRRSVIQVAELEYDGERVTCDRNKPVRVDLGKPQS